MSVVKLSSDGQQMLSYKHNKAFILANVQTKYLLYTKSIGIKTIYNKKLNHRKENVHLASLYRTVQRRFDMFGSGSRVRQTRVPSNLRHDHPRMRAFSYFRLRNEDGGHAIRSAIAENAMLHVTSKKTSPLYVL